MEGWFVIVVSLCITAVLKWLFSLVFPSTKPSLSLPPGPLALPFVGNLVWVEKSITEIEAMGKNLHIRYGPIFTLRVGSHIIISVADRSLAHEALVRRGAVFANRPSTMSRNPVLVGPAPYGPTWRLLRRNLAAGILHTARERSFGHARKWILEILLGRLRSAAENGDAVRVMDQFCRAMFCLLVLVCFGDKLGEKEVERIEEVKDRMMSSQSRLRVFNFWPWMGKILFRQRWKELLQLRRDRQEVLLPLIRARQELTKQSKQRREGHENEHVECYVDSLLDLEVPDEKNQKRKLQEHEVCRLCWELLLNGSVTTSTALQWIMANLVKHKHIQKKLYKEIQGVIGEADKQVKEEELQKMSYLRGVVLEGLRRHPPAHIAAHAVAEDTELGGYLIPKNASINFRLAEVGWDPEIWEDPMAFKPERFLDGEGRELELDITGSKEIKMMPFGAGRRICPGLGLSLLHLQYYVANLVSHFEWRAVEGDEIDLSEKWESTVVMKDPLRAHIFPRKGRGLV